MSVVQNGDKTFFCTYHSTYFCIQWLKFKREYFLNTSLGTPGMALLGPNIHGTDMHTSFTCCFILSGNMNYQLKWSLAMWGMSGCNLRIFRLDSYKATIIMRETTAAEPDWLAGYKLSEWDTLKICSGRNRLKIWQVLRTKNTFFRAIFHRIANNEELWG